MEIGIAQPRSMADAAGVGVLGGDGDRLLEFSREGESRVQVQEVVERELLSLKLLSGCYRGLVGLGASVEGRPLMRILAIAKGLCLAQAEIEDVWKRALSTRPDVPLKVARDQRKIGR